jgi:hypothetical protein
VVGKRHSLSSLPLLSSLGFAERESQDYR